jgi:hypothetical protein
VQRGKGTRGLGCCWRWCRRWKGYSAYNCEAVNNENHDLCGGRALKVGICPFLSGVFRASGNYFKQYWYLSRYQQDASHEIPQIERRPTTW